MYRGIANLCSVLDKQKEKKSFLLNLIFCLSHQDEEISLFNKKKAAAQAAHAQAQQATAQVAKEHLKGKKK